MVEVESSRVDQTEEVLEGASWLACFLAPRGFVFVQNHEDQLWMSMVGGSYETTDAIKEDVLPFLDYMRCVDGRHKLSEVDIGSAKTCITRIWLSGGFRGFDGRQLKTSCEDQDRSYEQQDDPSSTRCKNCHVVKQASKSMGEKYEQMARGRYEALQSLVHFSESWQ